VTDDLTAVLGWDPTEPLHPDLVPYIEPHPGLGQVLRHPLVYQVPYTPQVAAWVNKAYAAKVPALAEALAEGRWHTYVMIHERPHRLDALRRIARDERMTDAAYWSLVSEVWIDSENIWQNLDEWHDVLEADRLDREAMMDADERAALASMPDVVTIYRGCTSGLNEEGFSWSEDFARAEWFAKRHDHGDEQVVIEATCPRDAIIAVFHGRGENEVIVDPESVAFVKYREV
jgi:hypothetical protein